MIFTNDMSEKSITVVAHPDDEVLWFSSILNKVNEIVICFLDSKSHPHWKTGRQISLKEHAFKNISCLGLNQADIFGSVDWQKPLITKHGIEISKKGVSDKKYKENYYTIRRLLKDKLTGYSDVFTHNPWGEYGHEEHIQIYRIVKELQSEQQFNLWFSNYCSNSSLNLMLRYISGFDSEYVTFKTDKVMATSVKELYKKNDCWTWFDDWTWFNEESFMKDRDYIDEVKPYGHIFPLNMIKFEPFGESNKKLNRKSESWHKFIAKFVKSQILVKEFLQ
jgi:hypothetical protein